MINELARRDPSHSSFAAIFESDGNTYDEFGFFDSPARRWYISYNYGATAVYDSSIGWYYEAYRTITLDEPATGDFLTWLQANAVKQ